MPSEWFDLSTPTGRGIDTLRRRNGQCSWRGMLILRFARETKGLDLSQINREAWRGRRKLKAALFLRHRGPYLFIDTRKRGRQ
jgi:hypothetical protein